jgi:hypothetical protein
MRLPRRREKGTTPPSHRPGTCAGDPQTFCEACKKAYANAIAKGRLRRSNGSLNAPVPTLEHSTERLMRLRERRRRRQLLLAIHIGAK